MFLITHPNGLFYQYLQRNAINFGTSDETPLNFQITSAMLRFMERIFALPFQFTKYVFGEELMLFYIRTHYISFVKLYNKNFNQKSNEASLNLCKRHVGCLFAIAR
jgi:hypothetical protein